MADDEDGPEECDDGDDAPAGASDPAPARRTSQPYPRLDAFAGLQRQLAAIDFSALTAAQRAISQATAFQIPQIAAAQDAVAKSFAESINFSRLNESYRRVFEAANVMQGYAAQKAWAESLAKSIDFSALNNAIASTAGVVEMMNANTAFMDSLREQTEMFARLTQGLAFEIPSIDFSAVIAELDRWIPVNLREVDLDAVATVALAEGIPLGWVPRTEIVVALIEADDAAGRDEILSNRRDDILEDCDAALVEVSHEWAAQCRIAVETLRFGLDAPAQSHAANIIDSIVLALLGKDGRASAKTLAQEDFDDLPLQLAAENLTLRPLFRAFTQWWPHWGTAPPDYFARHATSHAVGHVGVFTPRSALIAVMLATSLTIQYALLDDDEDEDGEALD